MTLDLVVWNTIEALEVFIVLGIAKCVHFDPNNETMACGMRAQSCDLKDSLYGTALSLTYRSLRLNEQSSTVCGQHQVMGAKAPSN